MYLVFCPKICKFSVILIFVIEYCLQFVISSVLMKRDVLIVFRSLDSSTSTSHQLVCSFVDFAINTYFIV